MPEGLFCVLHSNDLPMGFYQIGSLSALSPMR